MEFVFLHICKFKLANYLHRHSGVCAFCEHHCLVRQLQLSGQKGCIESSVVLNASPGLFSPCSDCLQKVRKQGVEFA